MRFDPSVAGTRVATLTIANNDANENPYNFAIQGTGATAPEINLVGNAVSIVDGDTTPSTADFTDFGGADITAGTVTRTFTIQNTGTGALTLSGTPLVAVSGTNAADFTVTVLPAASVAAAREHDLHGALRPERGGDRVATLTIANNDANENPYNFAIQGTGTTPRRSTSSATRSPSSTATPRPRRPTSPTSAAPDGSTPAPSRAPSRSRTRARAP